MSDKTPRPLHELFTTVTNDMARECDGPDGTKVCFVCGEPAYRLGAPGWGGVWLCRECDKEATA